MKDSTQNIELIERYFDNEMSESEKQEFIEQVKNDLELRHLFDRERLLINTARLNAARNNLEFLKDLDKTLPAVNPEPRTSRFLYYAVAASVMLLIAVGIFVFNPKQDSPSELYAEYFVPYPNVFEPTVRGASTSAKRTQAFQSYEQGDYTNAASLFSELTATDRNPGMLMLLANANLAIGKTEEAKAIFAELAKKEDTLRNAATWYLAICYLKQGDIGSSRAILTKIAESDNEYSKRADAVLKKLE